MSRCMLIKSDTLKTSIIYCDVIRSDLLIQLYKDKMG
jgi:hypothetical protein